MLQIWEIGQDRHRIDRALTILAVAMPERSPDELARLCIGDRDGWLLRLREMTLGAQFVGMAQCPQCGEELELAMNIRDFGFAAPDLVVVPEQTIYLDEFAVQVHLPNSHDLAAVVGCHNLATADRQLLQSCIIRVDKLGESVSIDALPSEILDRISAQIAELDPRSEIILAPICPACEYSWQVLFDIDRRTGQQTTHLSPELVDRSSLQPLVNPVTHRSLIFSSKRMSNKLKSLPKKGLSDSD